MAVRHLADAERGWVRQTFRGEQIPDLYYRLDAPFADFEEADPAGAEEDFERYRAKCRPSMPLWIESLARGDPSHHPPAGLVLYYVDAVVT